MKLYTRNAIILFCIGLVVAIGVSSQIGGLVMALSVLYWIIKWGERDYWGNENGSET
jgi:hypothetical protein